MFHSDTQALIELWSRMSRDEGGRTIVPERRDLKPELLGARLARTFLIDRDSQVRLTGAWIEALHDRPIAKSRWLDIWHTQSETRVHLAIRTMLREIRPVVLEARIGSDQPDVEICLCPLRDEVGQIDLVLGMYAPRGTLNLPRNVDRGLTLLSTQPVGDAARASLSLASLHGRRIA